MDNFSIASLAIGAALVGLSNVPVVWSNCRRPSSKVHDGYSDEDGEATAESIKGLGGKWSLRFIAVLSLVGSQVGSIDHSVEGNGCSRRFDLAHCGFWTSLGVFVFALPRLTTYYLQNERTFFALTLTSATADQELSSSLWSRLTLGYTTPFLRFSGKRQGTMATEEFPELPNKARAERLHNLIEETRSQGMSLFQAICKAHKGAVILQVILALATAISSFGPHAALYGILKTLEDATLGSPGVWAAVLGVSLCVFSTFTSWVWWITYSKLAVPIASELQALLYDKTMRRKDIQQPKNSDEDNGKEGSGPVQQGQQEVINLVTVDTRRISDYASYNHLIPSSVAQFILACVCLLFLIGWKSLLAGLAAVFLMSPINIWIAQEYRSFQVTMMKAKDHRTSLVHEVVQNIRQIKFSATASAWEDRVLEARKHELRFLLQACFRETGFVAVWTLTPLLLSAVSLSVYALQYGGRSGCLASPIATALEAKMSVDRIDEYMQTPDKRRPSAARRRILCSKMPLSPGRATRNPIPAGFFLSNLNLMFPSKGLAVISGRTGSGKSLLLSAILGESDVPLGSVKVPSLDSSQWRIPPTGDNDWIVDDAIAYVPQEPWTENGTIRSNILFGLPLNWERYQEVLFATGLGRDLEILSDGDKTDIGANGVNLSGGQRARVSLARALYSRAGILIMDDIFSALDADTSRHVYENGLTGILAKGRTRVLATHHIGLCLPKADYCVVLEGGSMSFVGSADQLKKKTGLYDILQVENGDESSKHSRPTTTAEQQIDEPATRKFSPDEERAIGSVSIQIYKRLLTGKNSRLLWALGFTVAILYTSSVFARGWWLHIWTGTSQVHFAHYTSYSSAVVSLAAQRFRELDAPDDLAKYISVYVGISLGAAIMATLQVLFPPGRSHAVFELPVQSTPVFRFGRTTSLDVYIVDYVLGTHISELVQSTLQIVGVMVASTSVSPSILVLAAVLLAVSLRLAVLYLAAARELKRLESISRSPILDHFISSLAGLHTIRAFDQAREYVQAMFTRIDAYANVSRHLWLFNWWLQLRIGVLGAIFSTVTAAMVVKFGVSASLAGFAISFVLQYNTAVSNMVRIYASFEMEMNAAERVIDYASIETEPQGGLEPPAAWPTKGQVEVENLTVSYAPELPPALKGISFSIENNQRVGVVGRTGSGKSTLALALFRLMEPSEGRVLIDGLDTSTIKLDALRRRGLAIVPQHPTLFAGTVRTNLDPFGWYSETQLTVVLERVHLCKPSKGNSASFLNLPVSEGGANFSQGQRQLLCLARAILQQAKVMIMDEATSPWTWRRMD
ncbi:ABC transporter [Penicillium chermesinum]|nr:ABC transporter [Penicillium chermesinum]